MRFLRINHGTMEGSVISESSRKEPSLSGLGG